jgi:hypothetical protein
VRSAVRCDVSAGPGGAAFTELDGRPVAVMGGVYLANEIHVLDLAGSWPISRIGLAPSDHISGLVPATVDHQSVVLTYGLNGMRTWDLADGQPIGEVFDNYVNAVVVAEAGGRPVAIAGSYDAVRTWDLATRTCLDEVILPAPAGGLALTPEGTLVVGSGPDIIVFDAVTDLSFQAAALSVTLRSMPHRPWWSRLSWTK